MSLLMAVLILFTLVPHHHHMLGMNTMTDVSFAAHKQHNGCSNGNRNVVYHTHWCHFVKTSSHYAFKTNKSQCHHLHLFWQVCTAWDCYASVINHWPTAIYKHCVGYRVPALPKGHLAVHGNRAPPFSEA